MAVLVRFVLAETKQFQNDFETVLFQFRFVVRMASPDRMRYSDEE